MWSKTGINGRCLSDITLLFEVKWIHISYRKCLYLRPCGFRAARMWPPAAVQRFDLSIDTHFISYICIPGREQKWQKYSAEFELRENFKVQICFQLQELRNTDFTEGFIIWLQQKDWGQGSSKHQNTTLSAPHRHTQPSRHHTHTTQ